MVRSPRRLFGMGVLGSQRLAQDLLQVNELFSFMSITPNSNRSFESSSNQKTSRTK